MQPVAEPLPDLPAALARVREAEVVDMMHDAKPLQNWTATRQTFMGIDPSLTACGVAVVRAGRIKSFVLAPPSRENRGVARLAWFREQFHSLFRRYLPVGLALEGYSFGSKNSHSHALGELGGVLRLAAHDCRLQFVTVPPNTLKLFATGKGGASKEVVLKEAFKRWGIDVSDNNEADAGVLSLIAHCAFGSVHPGDLTSFQVKALEKVER